MDRSRPENRTFLQFGPIFCPRFFLLMFGFLHRRDSLFISGNYLFSPPQYHFLFASISFLSSPRIHFLCCRMAFFPPRRSGRTATYLAPLRGSPAAGAAVLACSMHEAATHTAASTLSATTGQQTHQPRGSFQARTQEASQHSLRGFARF